ncbi:MAG: protoheme IX farnesyltransferase [Bdellovibrionales bacterium]
MFKLLNQLTKFGIVIFVVLTGIAGYMAGFLIEQKFVWTHFAEFLLGLYFLSSGSLALNQVQEYKLDQKMPRTATRPIASGRLTPVAGALISLTFIFLGSHFLFQVSTISALLGWATIILYNGVYTYYWKPKWIYAAVPGAIPGALPITMGYAASNSDIFNSESVYLFMILFLWQMPHFWALALRFKDDYQSGDVPTLPAALGVEKTLFQMVMYTYVYVGLAIASPWFLQTGWFYLGFVIPVSILLLRETRKFYRSKGAEGWLRYFMLVNISVLVYVFVPVLDKWNLWF